MKQWSGIRGAIKMIRLNVPFVDNDEYDEIAQVLPTGYYTQGKKTSDFEKLVAEYIGSLYAYAMSSCTTALHLSLVALNVKPGDEVIVADFTFPATANVVVHVEAKPVLCDSDLDTYTINLDDLRSKITSRTKAIIPVHTFGCSADMDGVMSAANELEIPVIEDAACAIGATYKGKFCGNIGTVGCFSFHPRKVITTGEGGMITTNEDQLAERIKILRNHGGVLEGNKYQYIEAGFNYRLSDIQSAMGIAQMKKLQRLIDKKRNLAHQLKSRISHIDGITPPCNPPWDGHIYQSFVVLLEEGLDRNRIIESMKAREVETTIGTYALHEQPYFQKKWGYVSGQLPNSSQAFRNTLTLPLYPQMSQVELDQVVEALEHSINEG
jgi:perosamine synthetase